MHILPRKFDDHEDQSHSIGRRSHHTFMFGMIFASLMGIFRLMMFIMRIISFPMIKFCAVCLCMLEIM